MNESLGLAIVKMLDEKAQSTLMLKLKFVRNLTTLDVTNSPIETIIYDPKKILGILDLRLVGDYKINKGFCNKISLNTIDLSQQIF